MKAIKLLVLSGILALTSCSKDTDYEGDYVGNCLIKKYYPQQTPYEVLEDVAIRVKQDYYGYYFEIDCFESATLIDTCSGNCDIPNIYLNNRGRVKFRHELSSGNEIKYDVAINEDDLVLEATTFVCFIGGDFIKVTTEGTLEKQ